MLIILYLYLLFTVYSQKDLDLFLEHTRAKFVGFHVKNDTCSLAGLPQPIHEGVKVLNQVRCLNISDLTYCCLLFVLSVH